MRLVTPGRFLNALKRCKTTTNAATSTAADSCCCCFCLDVCCSPRQSKRNSHAASNAGSTPSKSPLKLAYYMLCYNELNDSISALETIFQPFMSCLNSAIRYFGCVKRFSKASLANDCLYVYYFSNFLLFFSFLFNSNLTQYTTTNKKTNKKSSWLL
jgi:hypothetical protein